jgi:phosphate starvation-inducible PhoH-like protein
MTEEAVRGEVVLEGESDLSWLLGTLDTNVKELEEASGVRIASRGSRVMLEGSPGRVERARDFFVELLRLRKRKERLREGDVRYAARVFFSEGKELEDAFREIIPVAPNKKHVTPKSGNQRRYVRAMRKSDLVLGVGPAGTGKTFLAMAMAVSALVRKEVSRIILTRPAVEAGEKLGFLPGDLYEKIHPYLRPLYDALYQMMDGDRVSRLVERGTIEIAPLAFMRGRTLDDSFIILDEGQNTTTEQMKMFLTRFGFDSKAVVTGDITQIDLPADRRSGLVEAMNVLKDVKGVETVHFDAADVVRHELVQRIVHAYADFQSDAEGRDGKE